MQENGAAPRDRHSDAGYCRNLRRMEKPASVQFKEKFESYYKIFVEKLDLSEKFDIIER